MDRRNIFKSGIAAAAGMFALRSASVSAQESGVQKVAYHLSDLEKVGFVLANIRNHIDGMGGADKVKIALVVHGPALSAFESVSAHPDVAQRQGLLAKSGVEMNACGNTLKSLNATINDLLPGFIRADRGGVVRLAELQGEGYVYLRP